MRGTMLAKTVNTPIGAVEIPAWKRQEFSEMSDTEIQTALQEQIRDNGGYSPIDPALYAEVRFRKLHP